MSRQRVAVHASRLATQGPHFGRSILGRASSRLLPCASYTRAPNLMPDRSVCRPFSTSFVCRKGIMPETDNPSKQENADVPPSVGVAELSDSQYHELADAYLDIVLSKFEQLQDSREDIDIEYSAGVMTINVANKGTYVINKQPPNKQIWLSSPISGPKRYDWCIVGEGQMEKEGTGTGHWVYTRDGVSLSDLILEELDVTIEEPVTSEVVSAIG
ncbi:mitochondrial iron uptake protein [Moelleriella libera RCEF 2490]|uniref:ferroxidase n=1 Tax=Moelleriella libera RCEF 2490 TaxID=1081109 RepID=A0A168E857_9HYPO|nr:mitochondrial iron uptake protein [Moelleriella libera RCEF 2490]